MSAFLSQVHYNMYDKMKFVDHLNQVLSVFIHQKDPSFDCEDGLTLPEGKLEDIIEHDQIHYWLQSKIQIVESRYEVLLEFIKKEGLEKEAFLLFQQEGETYANTFSCDDCLQLFQYLQQFILDGMPCEKGTTLIQKEKEIVTFHCENEVHEDIEDFDLFMNLRMALLQGILKESPFTIERIENSTFQLRKE